MRTALVSNLTGASGNAYLQVQEVRSTYFRDWWLRSTWNGSNYVLDLYRSYDEAVNQQSKMASGTHAAGEAVVCTLTVSGGAPFDATPISAVVTAAGTWTSAIVHWISGVQAALSDRFEDILSRYMTTNEVFEGKTLVGLGEFGPEFLPAIGWMPVAGSVSGVNPNRFERGIPFDFYFCCEGPDNASVVRECIEGTERLASILLDEQRKWGGFALTTTLRGQLDPAKKLELEAVTYRGTVPVTVQIPDFASERNPADLVAGSGGKYVSGL